MRTESLDQTLIYSITLVTLQVVQWGGWEVCKTITGCYIAGSVLPLPPLPPHIRILAALYIY